MFIHISTHLTISRNVPAFSHSKLNKTLEKSFFITLLLPPRDIQKNSCFEALDGCIMFSKINFFSLLVTSFNSLPM